MSRYWSALVEGLDPYVPGEQPKVADLVKLNTNEHPLGPSPLALAAMKDAVNDALRLYPDPSSDRLRGAIAAHHGVSADQVFVGNGSDEVLAHVFVALLKHDHGPLLIPDVTYSFYPVYCGLYGINYETVPLDDDFRITPSSFNRPEKPAGAIVFPNPNAPTGIELPLDQVETIVRDNPQAVVVVDEAYVDFGATSAVPLIARHDNVLTVHTLSKSRSLAGLRVGYAIGSRHLIEALERVKNSFNSYPVDRIAEAGAAAAINDQAYFASACEFVKTRRAHVSAALIDLGFEVLPSQANFVFARHPQRSGSELAACLRARKVIVRHFQQPRIKDFLRITIGNDEQNDKLFKALQAILS